MKMFIFMLILFICVVSFPYGWGNKQDNLEWYARKTVVLAKKAYPFIEAGLTKVFDSGKKVAEAAKEEIEK